MAKKILLAYATMSGSTAEVAQAIAEAIGKGGAAVDVRPLAAIDEVSGYDAVIVGGPMILGWHRAAKQFVARHAAALSQVPVALFITCVELTDTGAEQISGVPVYHDPNLGEPPKTPGRLSFKEKMTSVEGYVNPILQAAPGVKPVGVGIFAGKVDYAVLGLLSKLFVRIVIRAKAGDFRNWESIRSWAAEVGAKLT